MPQNIGDVLSTQSVDLQGSDWTISADTTLVGTYAALDHVEVAAGYALELAAGTVLEVSPPPVATWPVPVYPLSQNALLPAACYGACVGPLEIGSGAYFELSAKSLFELQA